MLLRVVVLLLCVVGGLSSILRRDDVMAHICPIDLEYNIVLKKCVKPAEIPKPDDPLDYSFFLYDDIDDVTEVIEKSTETTTTTLKTPVKPIVIDPNDWFD